MLMILLWIIMTPILMVLMGYAMLIGLALLMKIVRCLVDGDGKE